MIFLLWDGMAKKVVLGTIVILLTGNSKSPEQAADKVPQSDSAEFFKSGEPYL